MEIFIENGMQYMMQCSCMVFTYDTLQADAYGLKVKHISNY